MNHAEKTAWMSFVGGFISTTLMGFLAYFLMSGPTYSKFSMLRAVVAMLSGIMFLFFVVFFAFVLRKKQSAVEPDTDERDRYISKQAIQIAFVVICILMFFATALPMWIYGLDSSIPTVVLPLINLSVFMAALTVYNAVVLILYKIEGGGA